MKSDQLKHKNYNYSKRNYVLLSAFTALLYCTSITAEAAFMRFWWNVQSDIPGPITGTVHEQASDEGTTINLIPAGTNDVSATCDKCTTKADLAHYFRDMTKVNTWAADFNYKGVEFHGSINCDSKVSDYETHTSSKPAQILLTNTDIDTGHNVPLRMYVRLSSNNSNKTCMKELDAHQFFWSVTNRALRPISGRVAVDAGGYVSETNLKELPDLQKAKESHKSVFTDILVAQSTPKNLFNTSAGSYVPQWSARLKYNDKTYRLVSAVGKTHNNRECDITQADSNKSISGGHPIQVFIDGDNNDLKSMTVNPPDSDNCTFSFELDQ